MSAIFISYRREDSEGHTGRLFESLADHFGKSAVFMDVAGIEPGLDFRQVIDRNVAQCGVLLAVIGKGWLSVVDEAGQRRIDDPQDFVRLEVASALKRGIPVVPVLVQGAKMPRAEQLPPDLNDLAFRNAVEITHARWDSDVQVLARALERYVTTAAQPPAAQPSADHATALKAEPTPAGGDPMRGAGVLVKAHEDAPKADRQGTVLKVAAGALGALVLAWGGYKVVGPGGSEPTPAQGPSLAQPHTPVASGPTEARATGPGANPLPEAATGSGPTAPLATNSATPAATTRSEAEPAVLSSPEAARQTAALVQQQEAAERAARARQAQEEADRAAAHAREEAARQQAERLAERQAAAEREAAAQRQAEAQRRAAAQAALAQSAANTQTAADRNTLPGFGTNGQRVRQVLFGDEQGRVLGQYRNTRQGVWSEVNAQGRVLFTFKEQRRDEWSVYLWDPSRNVGVQLDLHARRVYYKESPTARSQVLYPIVMAR